MARPADNLYKFITIVDPEVTYKKPRGRKEINATIIHAVLFLSYDNYSRTIFKTYLKMICYKSNTQTLFLSGPFSQKAILSELPWLTPITESRDWNQVIGRGTTMLYYNEVSCFEVSINPLHNTYTNSILVHNLEASPPTKIRRIDDDLEILDGGVMGCIPCTPNLEKRYSGIIGTKTNIENGKTENLQGKYGSMKRGFNHCVWKATVLLVK